LTRKRENGETLEPFEEVTIDVDAEFQGMVIENMTNRGGNMEEFKVGYERYYVLN
jgi:GTP-binding protein